MPTLEGNGFLRKGSTASMVNVFAIVVEGVGQFYERLGRLER
jgi:hypothetical protein